MINAIDYLETHDVQDYLINEYSLIEIDSNYLIWLITLAEMNNLNIVLDLFKMLKLQLYQLKEFR